jgi:hypothetical protein
MIKISLSSDRLKSLQSLIDKQIFFCVMNRPLGVVMLHHRKYELGYNRPSEWKLEWSSIQEQEGTWFQEVYMDTLEETWFFHSNIHLKSNQKT